VQASVQASIDLGGVCSAGKLQQLVPSTQASFPLQPAGDSPSSMQHKFQKHLKTVQQVPWGSAIACKQCTTTSALTTRAPSAAFVDTLLSE
jgi:hypothetical protein